MSGMSIARVFGSALLLMTCVLLVPAAAEAGPRACAAATIEEPFVLPDGSEHAAGSLKICKLQRHYPTTTLLVSYVNGQSVGMLLGTAGHNEADEGAEPFMIFSRDPDGKLRLYGYGIHEGSSLATFTLRRPDHVKAAARLAAMPPA